MTTNHVRRPTLDLLRIVAAHLIVWHHFALYSGMADVAWSLAPRLFRFLCDDARKAVQVFLVLAGFFAAKACMPGAGSIDGVRSWARAVARRFMRLAPMLWLALALVLLIDATIGPADGEARTSWTTQLWRAAVHALMLQDVLGVPSLSPGLWYLPIDLQLLALAALLAWWGRSWSVRAWAWTVAAAVIASAWIFNRDSAWDAWAPYFMGAYGLGMLASCAGEKRNGATAAMTVATLGVLAALGFDFRDRLLLALIVAWGLVAWLRVSTSTPSERGLIAHRTSACVATVAAHADATYALFLLHDPVRRVVEAVWSHAMPATPHAQALGLVLAWIASIWGAHIASRLLDSRRAR